MPAVVALLQTCIDVWNEQVDALTKDVWEARKRQQKELEKHGEVPPATMDADPSPGLHKIDVRRSHNASYKHAQHFLRKYDFQVAKISKPGKHGKHLPMNDPLLIAVKEYVKAEVESGAVHPVLVGILIKSGPPCTNQHHGRFGKTRRSRAV